MSVKLQLALDLTSLSVAIDTARKTRDYVDFIEAGTPLIKSIGIECVRQLKKEFSEKTIVADMKTMDTGYLESKIAAEAGADIVSILAVAPNSTIKGALDARNNYGIKIMVDLIGVKNKLERVKQLKKMSVDYLIVHTGIDEQKVGKSPFKDVKKLSNIVSTKLAVAGGINDENVKMLEGLNVDVVIVGGYITKSKNPEDAAKKMKEGLKWLRK